MFFNKIILLSLCIYSINNAVTIDRVILACDANEMYSDFWPLVSKAWKEIVGVKPTLALIAPKDFPIDETLGDVIRFEPISGIPTSYHAQIIRLLLPAYFEDDVCIISDMDMIPLQKDHFANSVAPYSSNNFIIFNDNAFDSVFYKEYPMCYIVAAGKTFKDVFNFSSVSEIPNLIIQWYARNLGWTTDQQILYQYVENWSDKKSRVIKLGYNVQRRIDRAHWQYDKNLLKQKKFYIDSHMLRPYKKYKEMIEEMAQHLGLLFE